WPWTAPRPAPGLIAGDLLVGFDGGDGLFELLLQRHAELLVGAGGVAERIEGAELLGQALGLGLVAQAEHVGFGGPHLAGGLGLGVGHGFLAAGLGAE